MLDPKLRAQTEQGVEYFCEVFVPSIRRMFEKAISEGFTIEQAMTICLKYMEVTLWTGPQTMYP